MIGYSENRIIINAGSDVPEDSIQICNQIWKKKNMAIDDGLGGVYYPNNDINNVDDYGCLYTWDAAMRIAATVDGYDLPTRQDFNDLISCIGYESNAGGKLKATGLEFWNSPNYGATDDYNFHGTGAGSRLTSGSFSNFKSVCFMWTKTESSSLRAYYKFMQYSNAYLVDRENTKLFGFTVRLIKNK